ncbi:MAG: hypothetical protein AABW51_05345 [Nanoarchaeota archaeon]
MKWKEKGIVFSHRDGKKLLPDMVLTRKMLIRVLEDFIKGKLSNKELSAWEDYIWAHDPEYDDGEGEDLGDSFTNEVMGIIATDGPCLSKYDVEEFIKLLESKEDYSTLTSKLLDIFKPKNKLYEKLMKLSDKKLSYFIKKNKIGIFPGLDHPYYEGQEKMKMAISITNWLPMKILTKKIGSLLQK